MAGETTSATTRRNIMYVVAAVWLMSFVADVAIRDYSPSPYIHMAMMAVVSGLAGKEVLSRNGADR